VSIRTVHLGFILVSAGLCTIMAARFAEMVRADRGIGYAIAAALIALVGMALAGYGIRYRAATRGMDADPGQGRWSAER
jgi:hypothetical protein